MPKPLLLVVIPFAPERLEGLDAHFEIVWWKALPDATGFLAERGAQVQVLLTSGAAGLPAGSRDHLTELRLIACNGVGYDAIDMAWARAEGIHVTNTPDVLSADVADLALALLLGVFRQIPAADRFVREGAWASGPLPLGRRLGGSRVGILGLGNIGQRIAHRCAAFDTEVAYTGRHRKPDTAYAYFDSPRALAGWADVLIAATPGGAATRHLVSAEVLDALGPRGVFVNIARGSVVDEPALVARLADGRLAGAGLDVFADEPRVPAALLGLPQVVLSPHIASATHETRQAMAEIVVTNIRAFAEGAGLPTPIA